MKRYEVYWGGFLLGRLTVDGEKHKYEVVAETIDKVTKSLILDPAVEKSYDGEVIPFFKSLIEASDGKASDMYRLAEVKSFEKSSAWLAQLFFI